MESNAGQVAEFPMGDGATGTEMGDRVLAAAADLGLEGVVAGFERTRGALQQLLPAQPR
jgi:hypothetical protein